MVIQNLFLGGEEATVKHEDIQGLFAMFRKALGGAAGSDDGANDAVRYFTGIFFSLTRHSVSTLR